MKNILLLLAACFVVFASCKKKGVQTACYSCVANDSTTSNDPSFTNPHYPNTNSGTKCHLTDAQMHALEKEKTYVDTAYYNGVMVIDHWTYTCEFDQ